MKNYLRNRSIRDVSNTLRLILSMILIYVVTLPARSETGSQEQEKSIYNITVELNLRNIPLIDAFHQMEAKTGFTFSYHSESVNKDRLITVSGKSTFGEMLEEISRQTNLKFIRVDNQIHVSKKTSEENRVTEEETKKKTSQGFEVSGKVTSFEDGSGLPGVNIIEKGTSNGTVTDVEGNYTLAVADGATLVFSSVGFTREEVAVAGQSVINIQMMPDIQQLQELVVVGYGSVKKSDLTGSVVKVKEEDITALPVTNVLESLQGKVAGMDLTRSSGEAGSGLNIRIRGTRSIIADNGPLILVDGMPYGRNLDIPPSEVESIEILKDAASTAIYGSRGANGVILITTKRGKEGQNRITFNAYTGTNNIVGYPEFTLGEDWVEMKREAYKQVGAPLGFTDEQIFGADYQLIQEGKTVDWRDLIFREGLMQNYQLGASGGNEKTRYSLSADYIKEKGVIKLDEYNRYMLRATIDHKMDSWVELGTSLQFSSAEKDRRGNPLNQANKQPPYAEPFDQDGNINYYPFGDANIVSPLADEIPGAYTNQTLSRRFLSSSYVRLSPLDFLSFKSNISLVFNDNRDGFFAARRSLARSNQVSQARYGSSLNNSYQWENTLTLDKAFGQHNFQLLLGNTVWKSISENYEVEGLDVDFDNMKFYRLSATDPSQRDISSSYTQEQLLSYFGRINYSLMDRYLLTFVLRADGASQLAPGNKWQSFPSAAVAWKVTEESFMKAQNFISFLKFRTSYGISGNSAVDPYQTDSRLGQTMYSWGEAVAAPGYYLRYMAAEDLGWETTETFNIGVDMGFLEDRVTLTFERYWMNTTDLLLNKRVPYAKGYAAVMANIGETKNNGYEVILSSNNINQQNSGFRWTTDLTFSANDEKIVQLADSITRDVNNGWFVGHPVDVYYDYDKIGIWQLGEEDEAKQYRATFGPGEIKVRDVNNDTLITDEDKIILGTPRPDWTLGLNNRIEFKGFDFSVFVFARIGQMINSELHSRYDRSSQGVSYKADYWTEENPTNAYPKPNRLNPNSDLINTLGYVDGSFVKIRNITLGYSFPQKLLSRAGISQLRLYSTMKNYFTFSEVSPYDPERGGSGSSPMTKQWTFGLNLTF